MGFTLIGVDVYESSALDAARGGRRAGTGCGIIGCAVPRCRLHEQTIAASRYVMTRARRCMGLARSPGRDDDSLEDSNDHNDGDDDNDDDDDDVTCEGKATITAAITGSIKTAQ